MSIGDMVLCYTDGVIESSNKEGGLLGTPGLQNILNSVPSDRPERILPELVERIAETTGDRSQEDDVTMLLYRITDRSIPLRDNLAAPLRWLKSMFVKD